jgi:hypothetical protein
MSDDSVYCKVEEGGFTEQQINAFHEQTIATHEAWKAFSEKYNSDNMYIGNNLRGLEFKADDVPEGWTNTGQLPRGVYKPARRKACMDAYHEMKRLPTLPSGLDLAKMLNISPVFTGFSMRTPGFTAIGDEKILILAEGSDIPEGVTQLKTSEYWAMVEDEAVLKTLEN